MSEKMVEYLAEACNLYISNIRLAANSNVILPVVKNMNPDLFSAEDWSTSLSYIFMEPMHFETSSAAKDYYIRKLLELSNDNGHA